MNIGTLSQMLLIQSPINKHLYKHRSVTNIIILKNRIQVLNQVLIIFYLYKIVDSGFSSIVVMLCCLDGAPK